MDHPRGLVFRRPQAASPRRAAVYFCSAVLNRAAAMLRMCAMSAGKTSTALGAFYRRLAYRIGKAKAITATARKLAILVYRVLRGDIDYADPGVEAYEAQHRSRTLRNLRNRAQRLGLGLIDLETGELMDPGVS